MRRPDPAPSTPISAPGAVVRPSDDPAHAAPQAPARPTSGPASAKRKPGTDSPAEARGRLILSTAFVMVGPGGQLAVEMVDGQVEVLRDLVMRPGDFCGTRVSDDPPTARYCGGYADVAAAHAGAPPAPAEPDAIGAGRAGPMPAPPTPR